jgi:hypothetical protein
VRRRGGSVSRQTVATFPGWMMFSAAIAVFFVMIFSFVKGRHIICSSPATIVVTIRFIVFPALII